MNIHDATMHLPNEAPSTPESASSGIYFHMSILLFGLLLQSTAANTTPTAVVIGRCVVITQKRLPFLGT